MATRTRIRAAFTLIELLVVIAIIAILIALLVPAVQRVRKAAARTQCGNNIRQLGIGVHAYHDVYKRIPPNAQQLSYSWAGDSVAAGSTRWTWIARILPFIEMESLAKQYNIPDGTMGAAQPGLAVPIPLLHCPGAPPETEPATNWANIPGIAMSLTNYRGVSGSNWGFNTSGTFTTAFAVNEPNPPPGVNAQDGLDNGNGIFYRTDGRRKLTLTGITDGSSNTFMIGESLHSYDQHCGGWAYANYVNGTCAIPLNYNDAGGNVGSWPNRYSFRSDHGGGGHFCFGDCSVRYVQDSVNITIYRGLATIRGGEGVSLD